MTSLDAIVNAARKDFEVKFASLDLTSADGVTYNSATTMQVWVGYRAGYVQATSDFQATFVGHVYIKDEEYARLIAGQAK